MFLHRVVTQRPVFRTKEYTRRERYWELFICHRLLHHLITQSFLLKWATYLNGTFLRTIHGACVVPSCPHLKTFLSNWAIYSNSTFLRTVALPRVVASSHYSKLSFEVSNILERNLPESYSSSRCCSIMSSSENVSFEWSNILEEEFFKNYWFATGCCIISLPKPFFWREQYTWTKPSWELFMEHVLFHHVLTQKPFDRPD